MREKINIEMRTTAQDQYGESTNEWVVFASNIWASKEQLLGKEYYQAESFNSNVEVKFRCHWFEGVTNDMRIVNGNEIYEILSAINPKTLNRELLMYARRIEE